MTEQLQPGADLAQEMLDWLTEHGVLSHDHSKEDGSQDSNEPCLACDARGKAFSLFNEVRAEAAAKRDREWSKAWSIFSTISPPNSPEELNDTCCALVQVSGEQTKKEAAAEMAERVQAIFRNSYVLEVESFCELYGLDIEKMEGLNMFEVALNSLSPNPSYRQDIERIGYERGLKDGAQTVVDHIEAAVKERCAEYIEGNPTISVPDQTCKHFARGIRSLPPTPANWFQRKVDEKVKPLEEALAGCNVALADFLNVHLPDVCDKNRVQEAKERIYARGGVAAYIADLNQQARALLEKDRKEE